MGATTTTTAEAQVKHYQELRDQMGNRLDRWFEQAIKRRPNYEDGEHATIKFEIGRVGTGPKDEELWNLLVEEAFMEQG